MQRAVLVLVALSLGATLLWFRKEFADLCIKDQNRVWGFHFGEKATRLAEFVAVVVGAGFVVAGLLCLLGVGRIK